MDKNIIKSYLDSKFVNEAVGETPAISLAKKLAKDNKKINNAGVKAVGNDMKKYEKGVKKEDSNAKEMAPNKINYTDDNEKNYHDQMEIMNGQEMLQYDRTPNERFTERALEAIEGSSNMGNNPEWANVVEKGWGGDKNFGKELVKRIKASQKKRSQQTPTSKMFGDDWEVTKDEGHKSYAFESEAEKKVLTDKDEEDAMKGLDADYEKDSRAQQYGINPEKDADKNKNNPQIKESMKRLKFKKEFNGVGNALKLIPEAYKVDNKVFEMTDGDESYRIRWEGSLNEGKAVVLMASDKTLVNEDVQRMKQLFNYKSQDTLGTVKGKARIDENKAFDDVWKKTKSLMEVEDIDGQDTDVKQAPEAKKHVQGSASSEKGTKAPKPKEGPWEEADVNHAPEAKKHVQGSASSEKGTKAPKPKIGDLDDAVGHAAEAKKHVKGESQEKKKVIKEFFYNEEEDIDVEIDGVDDEDNDVIDKFDDISVGRKDAYDATLDVADPEDMEASINTSDLESEPTPSSFIDSTDDVDNQESSLSMGNEPSASIEPIAKQPMKMMRSKRTGNYSIFYTVNRKPRIVDVPSELTDFAREYGPEATLDMINNMQEDAMSDDDLMNELNKMIDNQ